MLLASYCDSVVQSFEAMQNNVMGIVGWMMICRWNSLVRFYRFDGKIIAMVDVFPPLSI